MKLIIAAVLIALAEGARADEPASTNILGQPLAACSEALQTGAFRDGRCRTGPSDPGVHAVCAKVTKEFLDFTASRGNDLVTPAPSFRFPGLKPGDRWCLCADRWTESKQAGVAPPVIPDATDAAALSYAPRSDYEAAAEK